MLSLERSHWRSAAFAMKITDGWSRRREGALDSSILSGTAELREMLQSCCSRCFLCPLAPSLPRSIRCSGRPVKTTTDSSKHAKSHWEYFLFNEVLRVLLLQLAQVIYFKVRHILKLLAELQLHLVSQLNLLSVLQQGQTHPFQLVLCNDFDFSNLTGE